MTGGNPWAVLCVAEDAPFQEVQRAFRRRVKQTHPDGGGDAGEFASVVRAFDAVRTNRPPSRRCHPPRPTPYDAWLRPCRPSPSWNDAGTSGPTASTATAEFITSDFTTVLRTELAKVAEETRTRP
jgi:hypothetical protein